MADESERTPGEETPPVPLPSAFPPSQDDPQGALKQRREETRLPAELREEILAGLPPPEERERLYRELQENGGLSSEQFLAALGLEGEPQP